MKNKKKTKKNFYAFLPALFIVGVLFLRISSVPTEQWTKDKVEKKVKHFCYSQGTQIASICY